MRLISSSSLWWLLLGAPIILLYLLKIKRTRQVVSSILLWRRAIQETQANAPFRKLRRNLLLILQLAGLFLIVLALSRPAVTSHALARGGTMIVLDATASMGAHDEDGGRQSRLERARQIVREMLPGVGGPTRAALIVAAARPRLVCPLSSDRSRLAAALDDIKQTDESGDLREAVLMAAELGKAQQGSEVVVISDGGGVEAAGAIDAKPLRVRYLRVGQRGNNVGIVAMNTRTLPGGRQELFASVANFSDGDRTVQAELRVNGALIDVRPVNLGPAPARVAADGRATPSDGGNRSNRRSLIFDSLPPEGGVAELKLDVDDDLSADNLAFAILKSSRRPSVGVASSNRFVWQALASDPDIEAHRLQADQESNAEDYDVLIAEGDHVSTALKSNRGVLCINPPGLTGFCVAQESPSPPSPPGGIFADQSHPVNNYISYAEISFDQRKALKTAGWLKPIVSDGAGGLIWAGDSNGKRTVLLGFDLAKTDLTLRMEFPILIANCITWLSHGETGGSSSGTGAQDAAVRTGQAFRLQVAAPRITIERPDGNLAQCEVRDGVATFNDTEKVGVYTAREAGAKLRASLLSSVESDTRTGDSITSHGGEAQDSAETYKSDREVWTWVLFGALVVLAVEWLVYLRRALGA